MTDALQMVPTRSIERNTKAPFVSLDATTEITAGSNKMLKYMSLRLFLLKHDRITACLACYNLA